MFICIHIYIERERERLFAEGVWNKVNGSAKQRGLDARDERFVIAIHTISLQLGFSQPLVSVARQETTVTISVGQPLP